MRIILSLLLVILGYATSAQYYTIVNPNKAIAAFGNNGWLFTNSFVTDARFTSPYIYGAPYQLNNIDFGKYIMTGRDFNNELVILGGGFRNSELTSGPLQDETAVIIDSSGILYYGSWKVFGSDILSLKADYNDNLIIDKTPTREIILWPGRNNPHFMDSLNFSLPDQDMAPFFDRNSDNVYNAFDGDYPIIGEAYPDAVPNEMTWMVFNDPPLSNYRYNTFPFEYQFMAYGFDCYGDTPIKNTIFTKMEIINRSDQRFFDLKLGLYTAFGIGCSDDDFKGTDPGLNTVYAYNYDSIDGPCLHLYSPGYLDTAGVVSCTYLNRPLNASIFLNPYSHQSFPQDRQTTDLFLDGITFSHLATEDSLTYDTVQYSFPDYPSDPTGDHMLNVPEFDFWPDSYSGTYFDSLFPGEHVTLENAWYRGRKVGLSTIEQPDILPTDIPIIKNFAASGYTNCAQRIEENCDTDCVWPGDANNDGYVYTDDFLAIFYAIEKQFKGPARYKKSALWRPFNSISWSDSLHFGTINAKHLDCYGDGTTDDRDVQVVVDNFGKRDFDSGYRSRAVPHDGFEGIRLRSRQKYILDNRPRPFISILASRDTIELNNIDLSNIKGIAFSIFLDSSIYALEGLDYRVGTSLSEDHAQDLTVFVDYDQEKFELSFAYYNSGGAFPQFIRNKILNELTLNPNLKLPPNQDTLFLAYPVFELKGIDSTGNYFDLDYYQDSVFLVRRPSATSDLEITNEIILYPNPTSNILHVTSARVISSLDIFDVTGKRHIHTTLNNRSATIDVSALRDGLYIIQLVGSDGMVWNRQLIVQKME